MLNSRVIAPRDRKAVFDGYERAAPSAVIAREKRAIQYSEAPMLESIGRGVLDTSAFAV
jgi:hypothetical protein